MPIITCQFESDCNHFRILIIDQKGNVVHQIGKEEGNGGLQFDYPHEVVQFSDKFFVADRNNDRIQIFNSSS